MLFYNDLRPAEDFEQRDYELIFPRLSAREKQRIITKLLELKRGLDQQIAARRTDENLIVASWNIKEFGHTLQRLPEAYFYIAEILSYFDLIAIQEIKSTLKDLNIILRLLGNEWGYLINDITDGNAGNSERSCYIFNKKRVELAGLAGEIVLWDDLTRDSVIKQLKRSPYITGFTAGWKTFAMINLHLHPGDDPQDVALRREEVVLLLRALAQKRRKGQLWSENLILVGDFNFYKGANYDDLTLQLIHAAGFGEVSSLLGRDTNASETQVYDRLFLSTNEYFTLAPSITGGESGGVFNPFQYVFKTEERALYTEYMQAHYTGRRDMSLESNQIRYYKNPWRKNQLSDHFPIWCELIIDSSPVFLERNLQALNQL